MVQEAKVGDPMSDSVQWGGVLLGFFGGLAIFLIGMDQMTDALKALAGHRLQRILAKLSGNRVSGALTGTVTTAALQSSSITTVLTVGFVSAKMLTVTQAASVIIGANLGTTITAQIIALNIFELALAFIAFGAVLWLFIPNRTWKKSGQAFAALGLVFFGLKVMSDAMFPLASYQPVIDVLSGSSNALLALVAGAVITALIQSSSATTGIVIALAAAGLVDLPTGIAIILGANVGTCVTALLAAIGKGRPALRTAMVHVLVNLLGALIWLVLLTVLVDLVQWISPSDGATPRQLANAHTIFNLMNTALFLLFLTPLVALATRLVPDKRSGETGIPAVEPGEFLDTTATSTAALGLPAAAQETIQLGIAVRNFFDMGYRNIVTMPIAEALSDEAIEEMKTRIRSQHRAIVGYLAELSHSSRDDEQSRQLLALVTEADELAHLADFLASSFKRINRRRRRTHVTLDPEYSVALMTQGLEVSSLLGNALEGAPESTHSSERNGEEVIVVGTHLASRDMDLYVLASDLQEILSRVVIASDRISETRET
jgi:phosphate:Na+ symporter